MGGEEAPVLASMNYLLKTSAAMASKIVAEEVVYFPFDRVGGVESPPNYVNDVGSSNNKQTWAEAITWESNGNALAGGLTLADLPQGRKPMEENS